MKTKITSLTKDEIISMYKKAKYKEEQVSILAQLTASDTDTILEILKDAGVYSGAYRHCPKCGKLYPALTHYNKGRCCDECRARSQRIANLKYRLKKNATKMQEIQRMNVIYREELNKLEAENEILWKADSLTDDTVLSDKYAGRG